MYEDQRLDNFTTGELFSY